MGTEGTNPWAAKPQICEGRVLAGSRLGGVSNDFDSDVLNPYEQSWAEIRSHMYYFLQQRAIGDPTAAFVRETTPQMPRANFYENGRFEFRMTGQPSPIITTIYLGLSLFIQFPSVYFYNFLG